VIALKKGDAVFGNLGVSALIGLLLGLAAIAFLQPTRAAGATLVMLVCLVAAISVGGLFRSRRTARRNRGKRR
jgi:hypothetical protein